MKKTIPLFMFFILIFSSFIMEPSLAHGEEAKLKEVKEERKQVKENLSKKEKEIVNVLDEIEKLHGEITKIEEELTEHNKHIAATEEKVMEYEDEFYELLDQVNELTKQIEKRTELLNKRLAAYQEAGGDISFLEVIFNAKSFIDFISRISSVTTITVADQDIIDQQLDDKLEIEEIQETIVEKINKQEKLIEELEVTKDKMNQKQTSLKQSEKQLKQKENNLKEEKKKLTKEDSELNQLENTYRERMKAREEEQKRLAQEAKEKEKAKATEKTETKTKENTTEIAQTSANSNNKESAQTETKNSSKTKTDSSTKNSSNASSSSNSSNSTSNQSSNNTASVGKTLRMEATAYTPFCNGCSGVTATGINVKNSKEQKIIAVDPSVIPLGSRVWVEGYGEAIAGDTGGAIKGNRIDVLVKSKSTALQWGRRTVTVKVLN